MRIIVSDTSCLIDLRKADLLSALLALPFRVQVALPLISDELSDFKGEDWEQLVRQGLEVVDLDGARVAQALAVKRVNQKLSAYDALSLVLAQTEQDSILLTGDRDLRAAASAAAVEVHGVLWVIDRIEENQLLSVDDLFAALSRWKADPLVFLPHDELELRLRKFERRPRP